MIDTEPDPDPKPARGRPRTMDSDKVLDMAVRAYWRGDPADVSLNAICEMAGIAKPSLYRAFGSEDGLTCAALDRYAEQVLSQIFGLLQAGQGLQDTIDALVAFASGDPLMETGCLFYKLRAGKHRLGPKTRARVEGIDAAAVSAFAAYLEGRRAAGDWGGDQPANVVARYLVEQIGLAFIQRAAGEAPEQVRQTLALALSVVRRG